MCDHVLFSNSLLEGVELRIFMQYSLNVKDHLPRQQKKFHEDIECLQNVSHCHKTAAFSLSLSTTMAVFIIFPKLETHFNTHYQNA